MMNIGLDTPNARQIQSIVENVGANARDFCYYCTFEPIYRDAKINCYEPNDELKEIS